MVAFQEYAELNNERYQALTCQVAPDITEKKDCVTARGMWTDDGQCVVRPVVRDVLLTKQADCEAGGGFWEGRS